MSVPVWGLHRYSELLEDLVVVSVPMWGLQSKVGAQKSIRSRVRPRMGITLNILMLVISVRPRVGITNITFQHIIKKKVVVRPRVGFTPTHEEIALSKLSCPSPCGDYFFRSTCPKHNPIVSVPVRGLLYFERQNIRQ